MSQGPEWWLSCTPYNGLWPALICGINEGPLVFIWSWLIRVQMVGGLTEGNEAGTCFLTTNGLVHRHFPTLHPLLDCGHNCTFTHHVPRDHKNVMPSWTTSDSILCSFWDRTYLLNNWISLWFLSVKIHTCIQGWLYNLGSSVQNENVGPLFQKQVKKVPIKVLRYKVFPSLPQ